MPLYEGQRIVLRDGRLATVGAHDGGNLDWRISKTVMDDGRDGQSLWTKLGLGNKLPETKYDWDAVADALTLTLPIEVGRSYITRDGERVTIAYVRGPVADGRWYIDTGRCFSHGKDHKNDIVTDAE